MSWNVGRVRNRGIHATAAGLSLLLLVLVLEACAPSIKRKVASQAAALLGAGRYWYSTSGGDNSFSDLTNWYLDEAHTQPATELPGADDEVVLLGTVSPVITIPPAYTGPLSIDSSRLTGAAATTGVTFSMTGSSSVTLSSAVTITGNATVVNAGTATLTSAMRVLGDASFSGTGANVNSGTISGDATFAGASENSGTVLGDAGFSGTSENAGLVVGAGTFAGTSTNAGLVAGGATFSQTSQNNVAGVVTGGASFAGASMNFGAVSGDATFAGTSTNSGTVSGEGSFADTATNSGTLTGGATFAETSTNSGTVLGGATFSGDSTNAGTVTGTTTFAGTSENAGTITGNTTFAGTSENSGTVTGTTTFADTSTNSGTIAGGANFAPTTTNSGAVSGTVSITGTSVPPPELPSVTRTSASPTNVSTISLSSASCTGVTKVLASESSSKPDVSDSAWLNCDSGAGAKAFTYTLAAPLVNQDNVTRTVYVWFQWLDGSTALVHPTARSVTLVLDTQAPAIPSTLVRTSPATPVNSNLTPQISVGGVVAGDTVTLHTDSACATSPVASGVVGASATAITLTSSAVTSASTTFYARATDPLGNASACSTSTASYNLTGATSCTLAAAPGLYFQGDTIALGVGLAAPYQASSVAWQYAADGTSFSSTTAAGSAGSYGWTVPAVTVDHSAGKFRATVTDSAGGQTICDATVTRIASKVEDFTGRLPVQGIIDGTGSDARFNNPRGATLVTTGSHAGEVYFFDGSSIIRKMTFNESGVPVVSWFSGQTTVGAVFGSAAASAYYFSFSGNLANDGQYLYFAQGNYGRAVIRVSLADGSSSILTGQDSEGAVPSGSIANASMVDGLPGTAVFRRLGGFHFAAGSLWANDEYTIRKINPETGEVTTIAGAQGGNTRVDADGTTARLAGPSALTSDATYLYIHDSDRIRRMTLASPHTVSTRAAIVSAVNFYPWGFFHHGGKIYLTNGALHTIQVLDLSNNSLSTLAGTVGSMGAVDGTGVASRFYAAGAESAPKFYFDAQLAGTIFKADASSVYIGHYGAVRKLDLSNNSVTTVAGPAPSQLNTLLGGSHARFTVDSGVRKIGNSVYFGQTPHYGTSTTVLRKWDLTTNQIVTLGGKPDDPAHAPQIDGDLLTTAQFNSINGIAQVGDAVYISDVCSIRKISGTSVSRVVGAYETAWRDSCGTTDGIGTDARLYAGRNYWGTRGVNLMASVGSSLYLLEPVTTCKIRKIDLTDPGQPVVTTLPGGGCGTPRDTLRDPVTGAVTQTAGFGDVYPQLETDGTYLYFSEFNTYGHTIRRVDPVTGDVTTIAGSPGIAGSADGIGTAARFNSPSSLAYDGGYLYIGDSNGVRRMNVTTLEVTTPFPGSTFPGLPIFAQSGRLYGQANAALASTIWSANLTTLAVSRVSERFSHNSGLVDGQAAVTLDNDNYQSDTYGFGVYSGGSLYAGAGGYSGQVLWKIAPNGSRTAAGGTFNSLALVSGSSAEDTSLTYPTGVAIIGSTAYVVSSSQHNLRAVNLQTGGVSLVAGTSGTSGSADGTGSGASFTNPTRITSDGTNLYVWDSGNRTIRKVVASSGVVTTILGDAASSTTTSLTDGVGSAARFGTVSGLLWVGGKLYITDSTHSVLREVTFAEDGTATITTIAGQGGTADVVDGTGTDARMYAPGIMTTDGSALYFVDNGKLRRYTIATGQLKTLFGFDGRQQSAIGNGLLGVARPSGFPVYDPDTHSIYLFGTWGIRVLR